MSKYIVAASIEKVQGFLFDVLQAHEQEKQTDKHTLQVIKETSAEMSESFAEIYRVRLKLNKIAISEELPSGSGNVFLVAELNDGQITAVLKILDDLYVSLYHHYKGKMRVTCGIFDYDAANRLGSLKEAKSGLKDRRLQNELIRRNAVKLFSFPCEIPEFDMPLPPYEKHTYYEEELAGLRTSETRSDERFRVAMLKADLDGMGSLFKKLASHEKYKAISETLSKWICMGGFHEFIKSERNKNPTA